MLVAKLLWGALALPAAAQEAGARVTTFAGTPVDPMQPGSMFCTNQVCADLLGRITV